MLTLALQFNIYFRDFHAVLQKDCCRCLCLCRCLFRYQKRSTRGRGVTKTTQEAFVNVASCALVHVACGHNTNKRTHALVELKCRRRRRRRRCCQLCPSAAARTSGLCPACWLLCSGPVLCVVCRCASQNLLTKLKDKHTNKVKTFGHRRKCWASANIVQPK